MIRPMLLVMYLEWDIEWENSMAVVIFTVLLVGIILGGNLNIHKEKRLWYNTEY